MIFLSMIFGAALVSSLVLPYIGVKLVKDSQERGFRTDALSSISLERRRRWALLGWLITLIGATCGFITYAALLSVEDFDAGAVITLLIFAHIMFTLRACSAKWNDTSL